MSRITTCYDYYYLFILHFLLFTGASQRLEPAIKCCLFLSFFSMSRFQGPAFRSDKIVVIVTLLEAIEGIPDKDCNFLGNDKFQETSS